MSEPYLRPQSPESAPPTEPPPGHVVEPAGAWKGRPMEVVYDPRRYDVAFLRATLSAKLESGLVDTGWEYRLGDGPNQMWVRDRMALAHRRLLRSSSTRAVPKIA